MFSQVSVKNSVYGECLPSGVSVYGRCLSRGCLARGCLTPLDTTGYGKQAGGTHPTGMHSCLQV